LVDFQHLKMKPTKTHDVGGNPCDTTYETKFEFSHMLFFHLAHSLLVSLSLLVLAKHKVPLKFRDNFTTCYVTTIGTIIYDILHVT
jgi:hypothetical protein